VCEVNALSSNPRCHCLLRRLEIAKIDSLTANRQTRTPKAAGMQLNASEPMGIVFANLLILALLTHCSFAQIFPAVVAWNSILMIDCFAWPFTSHIQPCQSMRLIRALEYTNVYVPSLFAYMSRRAKTKAAAVVVMVPSENAGYWIVIQDLTKTICGKIRVIHDALRVLIGEGPVARLVVAAGPAILAPIRAVRP
jgi:hypothetical protein